MSRPVVFRTSLVLVLVLSVGNCGERPPQYQLIPAILDGNTAKVESLLSDTSNVDVNWQAGGHGDSALQTAAAHNRVEIVGILLRHGADPNIRTQENRTPLLTAAYHGNTEVVRLLIEAGADVNVAETRFGFTPLIHAAWKGHADIVTLLLETGADRNARISDGRSAADLAYGNGHTEVVQQLRNYWPR